VWGVLGVFWFGGLVGGFGLRVVFLTFGKSWRVRREATEVGLGVRVLAGGTVPKGGCFCSLRS